MKILYLLGKRKNRNLVQDLTDTCCNLFVWCLEISIPCYQNCRCRTLESLTGASKGFSDLSERWSLIVIAVENCLIFGYSFKKILHDSWENITVDIFWKNEIWEEISQLNYWDADHFSSFISNILKSTKFDHFLCIPLSFSSACRSSLMSVKT